MNGEKHCHTKLIEDSVSDEDSFGAHDLVATSILQLIEDELGGKAIALTGPWGSGKSTTINLLRKKLNPETKLFVFDAWSHQGDPLRRTFLEKLLSFLKKDKSWLLENTHTLKFIEELSHRRKTTETKSRPQLTCQGKILSILLFLVPLGIGFLEKLGDIKVNPLIPDFGIVIVILPILFILFFTLLKKFTQLLLNRFLKIDFLQKCCNESNSVFEIFLEKSTTTTKSETIETLDPTSVEFHTNFQNLMQDYLKNGQRKLIIVIDNLDRVEARDALSLWSTMKTFFDYSYADNFNWKNYLWLIVPFDPSALNKLWNPTQKNSNNENFYPKFSQSFVDKTFNITFSVSPTLLSDWHSYLMKQLEIAFPDHNKGKEDFHNVYRVFRLNGGTDRHLPTPREIKTFVNSVGAIHRQWGDKIPLHLQSLFVIQNRNGWNPLEYLVHQSETKIQKEVPPEILPTNWRGLMAAIYFNAPIEKALQILIGDKVENAITTGNADALHDLKEIHGLTKEIESFVEKNISEWVTKQSKTIALAAFSITNAKLENDSSLITTWNILCANAEKVTEWKNLDEQTGKGIVNLIEHKNKKELFENILKSLNFSNPSDVPNGENPDQIGLEQWIKGCSYILKKLMLFNLAKEFKVFSTAWVYVHIVATLSEMQELDKTKKYFIPSLSSEIIIDELAKIVSTGSYSGKFALITDTLEKMNVAWKWDPFINALQKRFLPQNNLSNLEVTDSLTTLNNLAEKSGNAQNSILTLINQGQLAHYLSTVNSTLNLKAVSLCIFSWLKFNPDFQGIPRVVNVQNGLQIYNSILLNPTKNENLLKEIAELCLKYLSVEKLFDASQKYPRTLNFCFRILEVIGNKENSEKYFNPETLIEKYSFIKVNMNKEIFEKLLEKSVENQSFLPVLIKKGFNADFLQIYKCIYSFTKADSIFSDFLINNLKTIQKDFWLSQLNEEGPLVELLIYLKNDKKNADLTIALEDSLLEHAKNLLQGTIKKGNLISKWNDVVSSLTDSTKKVFLKRIIEIICHAQNSTQTLIEYYGETLLVEGIIKENKEELFIEAFKNFLDRLNDLELRWMEKICKNYPETFGELKSETRAEFFQRLTDKKSQNAGNKSLSKIFSSMESCLSPQI